MKEGVDMHASNRGGMRSLAAKSHRCIQQGYYRNMANHVEDDAGTTSN